METKEEMAITMCFVVFHSTKRPFHLLPSRLLKTQSANVSWLGTFNKYVTQKLSFDTPTPLRNARTIEFNEKKQ